MKMKTMSIKSQKSTMRAHLDIYFYQRHKDIYDNMVLCKALHKLNLKELHVLYKTLIESKN